MIVVDLWAGAVGSASSGPGGWAFVARVSDGGDLVGEREGSGGDPAAIANQMQLTAVLEGLKALARPSVVEVHIASPYVSDAFVNGTIDLWVARNWKRRVGSGTAPIKHAELWQQLYTLSVIHQLQWTPGRGEAGAAVHRRVARLADAARTQSAGAV